MKPIFQVFSLEAVMKLLLGVAGLLLIHFMPAGQFADYTYAMAAIAFITQALSATFNRIYIVGTKSLKLHQHATPFLGFQIATMLLMTLVTFPWLRIPQGTLAVILTAIFATCCLEFSKTVFQNDLKFVKSSFIEIGRILLYTGGLGLLILFLRDRIMAPQVLWVQAGALLAAFLLTRLENLHFSELFKIGEILRFIRPVFQTEYRYLFLYFFILAFFSRLDVFMLKSLSDDMAVATYGSAFRYYSFLLLALEAVNLVYLPLIQKMKSHRELEDLYAKHRKMLAAFVILILIGGWLSQWIIPFIDKGKYPGAVLTFRILAASAVVSFAWSPHANLVMNFKDFKFLFLLIAAVTPFNLLLHWMLIPLYGPAGAAAATLLGYGVLNGLTYLRAGRRKKVYWQELAAENLDRDQAAL